MTIILFIGIMLSAKFYRQHDTVGGYGDPNHLTTAGAVVGQRRRHLDGAAAVRRERRGGGGGGLCSQLESRSILRRFRSQSLLGSDGRWQPAGSYSGGPRAPSQ